MIKVLSYKHQLGLRSLFNLIFSLQAPVPKFPLPSEIANAETRKQNVYKKNPNGPEFLIFTYPMLTQKHKWLCLEKPAKKGCVKSKNVTTLKWNLF